MFEELSVICNINAESETDGPLNSVNLYKLAPQIQTRNVKALRIESVDRYGL